MVVGALHKQRSDKIVAQAEERVRAYIEQSPTPVFCWELASPAVVSNSLLSIAGSLERARLVECSKAFMDEFTTPVAPVDIGSELRDLKGRPARAMGVLLGALLSNDGVLVDKSVELEVEDTKERFILSGRLLFAGGGIYRIWGNIRNVTEAARIEREALASRERIELAASAGGLGFLEWFDAQCTG